MNTRRQRQAVPVGDTDAYQPSPDRPVRCRARAMGHDTQFEPHHHAWGQLAYCASGLLQVTVTADASADGPACETTTIVPPSRAVWIPPLARLFRDELGMGFQRWRQQVVLAHAMPMLARGVSVGRVAQASGYASESAFSAMFKSAMGLPPTRLLAQNRARPQAATASSTRA